jgi:uncharacterized protein (TIGR02594 family)
MMYIFVVNVVKSLLEKIKRLFVLLANESSILQKTPETGSTTVINETNMNGMRDALAIAKNEIGVTEKVGSENNPRILEYHKTTTLQATDENIPWCAAFVNWCLQQAGMKGTGLANARSFLTWGREILPDEIEEGDIIVMGRTSDPTKGHVGFFVGWTEDKFGFRLLGGNQLDGVNIKEFDRGRIISIRRNS